MKHKVTWGVEIDSSRHNAPTLNEIMSEQLAETMESGRKKPPIEEEDEDPTLALALALSKAEAETEANIHAKTPEPETVDEATDVALAMQLQEEEEAAWEHFQNTEGRHLNGKVSIRPRFQRQSPPRSGSEQTRLFSADDAEELSAEHASLRKALEDVARQNAQKEKRRPPWPVRNKNLKGQGGDEEIITKHDKVTSGRKNWERLQGDAVPGSVGSCTSKAQFLLSNKVYNSLRNDLKKQRGVVKGLGATVERDAKQTYSKGLDQKTRLILQKLVNSELLDSVNGVVRTGKEAVIYHASGYFDGTAMTENDFIGETSNLDETSDVTLSEQDALEEDGWSVVKRRRDESRKHKKEVIEDVKFDEFAVKVFKTTLNEFKNRLEYVKGDYRFRDVDSLTNQNPRKVVKIWAEKEIRNLSRVRKAGIPCPFPVRLVNNVLVMEFIGKDCFPAPQLREVEMTEKRCLKCYAQVTSLMYALMALCGLVHADLSEYNILYMNGKLFLIDFGQAVRLDHPNADKFLSKDCTNITTFFRNHGLPTTLEPEELAEMLKDALSEASKPTTFEEACEIWSTFVDQKIEKDENQCN